MPVRKLISHSRDCCLKLRSILQAALNYFQIRTGGRLILSGGSQWAVAALSISVLPNSVNLYILSQVLVDTSGSLIDFLTSWSVHSTEVVTMFSCRQGGGGYKSTEEIIVWGLEGCRQTEINSREVAAPWQQDNPWWWVIMGNVEKVDRPADDLFVLPSRRGINPEDP